MIKLIGRNSFGTSEYVVSTEAEITQLPVCNEELGFVVGHGSTALVIENSKVFMFEADSNSWKEI